MKWLAIAMVVAACGRGGSKEKTHEEVKKEWTPKVQAKLEKVVAAAKVAEGAELGSPGDSKLELDFDAIDMKARPNAIAAMTDDVQSATAPRPVKKGPTPEELMNAADGSAIVAMMEEHPRITFQSDSDNPVYLAKVLAGVETNGPTYSEYKYDQFVGAKYLLVVTRGAVEWPHMEGQTFQPGTAKLHAVLVDIDSAKPLGGFEAEATNSDKVTVHEADSDAKGIQKKLDKDLLGQVDRAIAKGIEQRWPGAKTPATWGLVW